jgi:hypothetical protein
MDMTSEETDQVTGAWIVHHRRKIALDANGASEFPVLDEAGKAADLPILFRL